MIQLGKMLRMEMKMESVELSDIREKHSSSSPWHEFKFDPGPGKNNPVKETKNFPIGGFDDKINNDDCVKFALLSVRSVRKLPHPPNLMTYMMILSQSKLREVFNNKDLPVVDILQGDTLTGKIVKLCLNSTPAFLPLGQSCEN